MESSIWSTFPSSLLLKKDRAVRISPLFINHPLLKVKFQPPLLPPLLLLRVSADLVNLVNLYPLTLNFVVYPFNCFIFSVSIVQKVSCISPPPRSSNARRASRRRFLANDLKKLPDSRLNSIKQKCSRHTERTKQFVMTEPSRISPPPKAEYSPDPYHASQNNLSRVHSNRLATQPSHYSTTGHQLHPTEDDQAMPFLNATL
ncbi:hypothetical protein J6590_031880 [Homalodisca vitripennis]|nr:hypothetical protein J6590_031880 [Homalodisca vitripennis]